MRRRHATSTWKPTKAQIDRAMKRAVRNGLSLWEDQDTGQVVVKHLAPGDARRRCYRRFMEKVLVSIHRDKVRERRQERAQFVRAAAEIVAVVRALKPSHRSLLLLNEAGRFLRGEQ